jgi:hypothetical protein
MFLKAALISDLLSLGSHGGHDLDAAEQEQPERSDLLNAKRIRRGRVIAAIRRIDEVREYVRVECDRGPHLVTYLLPRIRTAEKI